ncbi:MAG: hypothetical protein ACI4MH_06975 [Candidatus Coproplasma sp.]
MSIIVAVKENGVVYMGADSQTTICDAKRNGLNRQSFKIKRLKNGMLVAFCGKVSARDTVLSMEDLFVLDEHGGLTKKHIVNNVVPRLVEKMESIGDEDSGEMNVEIWLAYKDKLYRIAGDLSVMRLNTCGRMGSGVSYGNLYLFGRKDCPSGKELSELLWRLQGVRSRSADRTC